jgi:hypothetical protein
MLVARSDIVLSPPKSFIADCEMTAQRPILRSRGTACRARRDSWQAWRPNSIKSRTMIEVESVDKVAH